MVGVDRSYRMNEQDIEIAFRRGILKTNRQNIERIRSRATDLRTGKVYEGEAGKLLKRKQLEQQAFYERNKRK